MTTTKKILIVIGVIALLAVIGFGLLLFKGFNDGAKVQGVLTNFLTLVSAGNLTSAYALTAKDFQQSIPEASFAQMIQKNNAQYSGFQKLTQTGFNVAANTGQPIRYQYAGSITYNNGDIGKLTATLLNENGGYKIEKVNVTVTPARLAAMSGTSEITTSSTLASSAAANNGASTWVVFDSVIGHFQASFPVYPTDKTRTINAAGSQINVETYEGKEADGTAYVIQVAAYSSRFSISDPQSNLERSLNEEVQVASGTLISSNPSTFLSYPAIDSLALVPNPSNPGGYVYIRGKDVAVGHDFYEIYAVYEAKNSANVQFDKFVNSFQFQ